MKTYRLSKSQFIRGLQCYKSLWLYNFKPELRKKPDSHKQAVFDTGTEVGILARQLFPGGTEIVFSREKIDQNIHKTRKYIEQGIGTIYEATFKFDDVLVMVDILYKGPDGWELYEVKSSTSNKGYERDLAVQNYVLNGAGINVVRSSLVHINNKYVRFGELELEKLFKKVDLTTEVSSLQGFVKTEIENLKTVLKSDKTPLLDIGAHCSTPYECDFIPHCWQHIPEISVFNLYNMDSVKKFDLYGNGILNFSDIPPKYPLTESQKVQVKAELTKTVIVDKPRIRTFLKTVRYPLYFLDFESFQQAIPCFNNLSPYEQIPFQFSLHILENRSGNIFDTYMLRHREFLAKTGADPRKALAEKLLAYIPDNVCVIAYSMDFEKQVIKKLAAIFPEYSDHLLKINSNMIDLLMPFKNKSFYSREMGGSASIKYVLPALIPELGYSGMTISNGREAGSNYGALNLVKNAGKVSETRKNLLEYCRLDTYAMVKILEKLYQSV